MKRESSGVATLLKKTVRVSTAAASVKGGTHAALRSGDNMLIHDLLYAMMLPSGNDAATALAEVFGKRMLAAESRAVVSADGAGVSVGRFVKEMNRVARRHGLDSIKVYNPHGMRSTKNNKANVRDVIRLMELAVQNPVFVEVYGTKGYSCRYVHFSHRVPGRPHPRAIIGLLSEPRFAGVTEALALACTLLLSADKRTRTLLTLHFLNCVHSFRCPFHPIPKLAFDPTG
jgi:hypothetical protein